MDDEKKQAEPVDVGSKASGHNESRRRWLKKAGMSSPALLLLVNRPAMASSCSISGFMSADVGTSLTTYSSSSCRGWSPGNWKNANGQIGDDSWDMAGVTRGTSFSSVFNTDNLANSGGGIIRKLVNGVPEDGAIYYVSAVAKDFQSELHGGSSTSTLSRKAAASYLNASFLANGGATSRDRSPEDWMANYPAPGDIIGLYLLYELSDNETDPNVVYQLERGGFVVGSTQTLVYQDFYDFFNSISDDNAASW